MTNFSIFYFFEKYHITFELSEELNKVCVTRKLYNLRCQQAEVVPSFKKGLYIYRVWWSDGEF